MKPNTTILRNIGPHAETVIHWDAHESPVALCAPNGSGKTMLLEGDALCLYGQSPSYGRMTDAMTLGAVEASITTEFEVGGVRYRATRSTARSGATVKSEAMLELAETGEALAGPKIRDFEARVVSILGPYEVALATWFAAQGSTGDICEIAPADRRAVLGEILELDALNRISADAAERAKSAEAEASVLEGQVAGVDLGAEIDGAVCELTDACNRKAEAEAAIGHGRDRIATLEGEANDLKDKREAADRATGEYAAACRAQVEARESVLAAEERLATVEAIAARRPEWEAQVAERDALRARLGELEVQSVKFRARGEWEAKRTAAVAAVSQVERRIKDLEAVPGASPEEIELAAGFDAAAAEYKDAKAENERRAESNAKLAVDRAALRIRIDRATEEIKRIDARLAAKPETPGDPEACAACPLLREFADIPAWRATAVDRTEAAEAELALMPADEPMIDLEPIIKRGEAARAAKRAVEAAAATLASIEAARAELAAAWAECDALNACEPEQVEDPREEHAEVCRAIDLLDGCADRLAMSIDAAERLPALRAAAEVANDRYARACMDATALSISAKDAARMISDIDARLAELAGELRAERLGEVESSKALLVASNAIARLEERLVMLRQRAAETEAKRARAAELRTKAAARRTLQAAFGPKGIQPILVDQAVPELEAIAAGMLDRLTGGRMRLRIATQRATAGAGVREDLLIYATDEVGERDVRQFSGGERRILRTVLRLAIAEWIGRLRGQRPTCLRIDEGFDALDHDNRDAMIGLLRDLGDRYEHVMVVTHDPEIAEALPGRIELAKRFSGVLIGAA